MFGIGGFELFLILIFGFLIFGPDKLPAMAKTLGKAISKFRNAQEEMNKVIKNEVYDPNSDEPFKNPLEAIEKAGAAAKESGTTAKKPKVVKAASASSASSAASVEEAPAVTPSGTPRPKTPRQESFSERKARYDRERAARRAAEAEKQKAAASSAAASQASAPAASASQAASSASTDEKKGE